MIVEIPYDPKHGACCWWIDERLTIVVSFPGCSSLGYLGHAVAADGTVRPKIRCREKGCKFHRDIRLMGWPGWTVPDLDLTKR